MEELDSIKLILSASVLVFLNYEENKGLSYGIILSYVLYRLSTVVGLVLLVVCVLFWPSFYRLFFLLPIKGKVHSVWKSIMVETILALERCSAIIVVELGEAEDFYYESSIFVFLKKINKN